MRELKMRRERHESPAMLNPGGHVTAIWWIRMEESVKGKRPPQFSKRLSVRSLVNLANPPCFNEEPTEHSCFCGD